MTNVFGSVDGYGLPLRATDGDLGEEFYAIFGRLVVLAAAIERQVTRLEMLIMGKNPLSIATQTARPIKQTIDALLTKLRRVNRSSDMDADGVAVIEAAEQFLNSALELRDLRNGYVHSAWLVDDRRPFANDYERRPEFLAIRVSDDKDAPGLKVHHPCNIAELREDLNQLIDLHGRGSDVLDAWHRRGIRIDWSQA